jgi:hypothetical protein
MRHKPIDSLPHHRCDGHPPPPPLLRSKATHLILGQGDLSTNHMAMFITRDYRISVCY